nr:MerR family transcriptional regulator [uncultured Sphingomonas sp.]
MPTSRGAKDPAAFRTIGEVSAELGIAQHILRYWESRFPQLKPLQRAGNRRYYRPEDVELVRQIHSLLSQQGYTVRGVQQLLKGKEPLPEPAAPEEGLVEALKRVRAELTAAIAD